MAVKHAIGFNAAEMMPPESWQRLIREGVKRGVERRSDIKPYKIAHPVKLQIRFNDVVIAELASDPPGRTDEREHDRVYGTRHDRGDEVHRSKSTPEFATVKSVADIAQNSTQADGK